MVKFPLAAGGHFTLMLSLGVIPCEYPDNLYLFINYQTLKTARSYLQCLDKTPECDRRTDRSAVAITALCIVDAL